MAKYPYEQIRKLEEYKPEITRNYMTGEEIEYYIRSKNLDLRTIEQIVSFFMDNDRRFTGGTSWWDKKEIVRYVHKENFSEIWPKAVKEIEKASKRKAGL